MKKIQSIKDEHVVQERTLATSQGRLKNHQCLVYDKHQIIWGLEASLAVLHVFVSKNYQGDELQKLLAIHNIECFEVSEGILKKITGTNYVTPVVAVVQQRGDASLSRNDDFVVVLDGLQDHGNIGTIILTASAFGIDSVAMKSPDADVLYRKTIDASRGKVFNAKIARYESDIACVKRLQEEGFQVVAQVLTSQLFNR